MSGWTIGSIWEETRAIVREQAWVFAPVAAAFMLLPSLAFAFFFPDKRASPLELPSTEVLWGQVASALISIIAEAFILIVALRRDNGRPVGQLIGDALRLVPRMVAVKLIIGVTAGLALVLLVQPSTAVVGLVLILPAMYVLGRLSVAPAAMVAESIGVLAALQRGWELGRRDVWRILSFLALILVAAVGAMIMLIVVANAVALVLQLLGIDGIETFLQLLTGAIALTVVTVYGWTGIAVIYRRIVGVS